MSTHAAALSLPPALRSFPGAVLEVARSGIVLASNGRLEARLERGLAGCALHEALDAGSRGKLDALLRADDPQAPPAVWELVMEGRDTGTTVAFHVARDPGVNDRVWLVECLRDPRLDRVYEEFAALMSEQATMQRQLAKEKARLARALEEVEREFQQNERLSRTLQSQNEEMEAQNEELLSLTEELHAGQEQLMSVNHQMERRTRELQLALSARNRFYAAMSHELRTPINAVMGYNDLLLGGIYGGLNEQQELAVERSQRAARHLRELVNDVLDISKLEAGKVEVEFEEVRLGDLVEDLFATLRPVADAQGVELKLMQRDMPRTLVTDPRRVRQIVLNLLSNAVKFGRGRPVWVNLTRASDGGVDIEVVDGGDGIRSEDMGRIFEEFVQLERGENHEGHMHEGTGLGLPIARRLARLVGGTLDVASTPGVGSTFRLSLPPTPPGYAAGGGA
jgi:signal transduction histidine kinase